MTPVVLDKPQHQTAPTSDTVTPTRPGRRRRVTIGALLVLAFLFGLLWPYAVVTT